MRLEGKEEEHLKKGGSLTEPECCLVSGPFNGCFLVLEDPFIKPCANCWFSSNKKHCPCEPAFTEESPRKAVEGPSQRAAQEGLSPPWTRKRPTIRQIAAELSEYNEGWNDRLLI